MPSPGGVRGGKRSAPHPRHGAHGKCTIHAQCTAHKVGSAKPGSQTGTQGSGGPVRWTWPAVSSHSDAGMGRPWVCGREAALQETRTSRDPAHRVEVGLWGPCTAGPGAGHPRSLCIPPGTHHGPPSAADADTETQPPNHARSWQSRGKQHTNATGIKVFFLFIGKVNIFL